MNKTKKTLLALIFLVIFHSSAFAKGSQAEQILITAKAEIGNGEIGKNNSGRHVQKYLRCKEQWAWCAGFVSYVLKQSGVKVSYTLRAKTFLTLGEKIETPQGGDISVFNRKGGGHVGIVEQVFDTHYITIEGNKGNYPAKVKRIRHSYNEKNFIAFIRIKGSI